MKKLNFEKRMLYFYITLFIWANVAPVVSFINIVNNLKKEGRLVQEFTLDRVLLLILMIILFALMNVYIVKKITRSFKHDKKKYDTDIQEDFLIEKKKNNTVTIALYMGNERNLKVPEKIAGCRVVKINSYAIISEDLEKLELADNIVSIGSKAFSGCDNLVSVKLPEKLKKIGGNPFYRCKNLKEIIIPKGNRIFQMRDGILYDTVSKKLLSYPSNAREASFTVPDTVSTIASFAFAHNSFVKEIIIPDSVVSIKTNPFHACQNLDTIIFSDNNPYFVFENGFLYEKSSHRLISYCGTETETHIPEGIVTIGRSAFMMNTSLKKIILPNSVKTIENESFYFCDSLTEVILPEGLTSIGEKAFSNLYDLNTLVLPTSITHISENAFGVDSIVKLVVYKDSYSEQYAKENEIEFTYIDNG